LDISTKSRGTKYETVWRNLFIQEKERIKFQGVILPGFFFKQQGIFKQGPILGE